MSIKLLTFNTYGLKFVSKFREERLHGIADQLANSDYDIVALQEVWVEADWDYIDRKCKGVFPYRRIFKSGILTGPGLAILSKIPIERTFLYRFPINGRPSAFFRGDWFVGKSIAVTVLRRENPGSPPLVILNSHMHAPYAQLGDAAYSTHRACQAWDMANLVRTLQSAGYAVIQVGDLNSKPGSLPYKLFTQEGGLADSWDVLHNGNGPLNEDISMMSPQDQIELGGVTCNSTLNTWRSTRAAWEACRLDYALIDRERIVPLLAAVRFTEPISGAPHCSYSDHFAYELIFRVESTVSLRPSWSYSDNAALYDELIREISTYLKEVIPFQANWRKMHFILSIIVAVAILVGMTFAADRQGWASVILGLAVSLIMTTGVMNGLIWGLGVRSEKRALQEVLLEVEDAQMSAGRRQLSQSKKLGSVFSS